MIDEYSIIDLFDRGISVNKISVLLRYSYSSVRRVILKSGRIITNRTISEEHKAKIGNSNKGKKSWCKGMSMPKEFGDKISKTHKKRNICPSEYCHEMSIKASSKNRDAAGTYRRIAYRIHRLERVCERCGSTDDICIPTHNCG